MIHFNGLLMDIDIFLFYFLSLKLRVPNSKFSYIWKAYGIFIFNPILVGFYNYLCNQYLSPLMLWVRISISVRCTTLCDQACQWPATILSFSPGPPVSSTNKTDRHNITEILLKVALNTIKQTNKQILITFLS